MKYFVIFLIGALFGLGLGISQMSNPDKVLGFLNFAGNWDPTLLVVMAGATGVYFAAYQFLSRSSGFRWEHIPTKTAVDVPLIIGPAIFGIGWGLIGFCPGPSLTALATGKGLVFLFVGSMTAGMLIYRNFNPFSFLSDRRE